MHRSQGSRGTIKISWFNDAIGPSRTEEKRTRSTLDMDIERTEAGIKKTFDNIDKVKEKIATAKKDGKHFDSKEERLSEYLLDLEHLQAYLKNLEKLKAQGAKY